MKKTLVVLAMMSLSLCVHSNERVIELGGLKLGMTEKELLEVEPTFICNLSDDEVYGDRSCQLHRPISKALYKGPLSKIESVKVKSILADFLYNRLTILTIVINASDEDAAKKSLEARLGPSIKKDGVIQWPAYITNRIYIARGTEDPKSSLISLMGSHEESNRRKAKKEQAVLDKTSPLQVLKNNKSYDIKGIKLNMTEREVLDLEPSLKCSDVVPNPSKGIGDRGCINEYPNGLKKIKSYGSSKIKGITVMFLKGKVYTVSLHFPIEDKKVIARALEIKYGKPTINNGERKMWIGQNVLNIVPMLEASEGLVMLIPKLDVIKEIVNDQIRKATDDL